MNDTQAMVPAAPPPPTPHAAPGWLGGALKAMADQPQVLATSIGTIAIGLVGRRPEMIRGGTRMLATHLIVTMARASLHHALDHGSTPAGVDEGAKAAPSRGTTVNPPARPVLADAIIGSVVGWAAQAAVDAAFRRLGAHDDAASASRPKA